MSESTMYQFRLDADEKKQAFDTFKELGIKPAQAIRLFLRQVTATKSIPFEINVPNATTLRAMKEAEEMIANQQARFATAEELFNALENHKQ